MKHATFNNPRLKLLFATLMLTTANSALALAAAPAAPFVLTNLGTLGSTRSAVTNGLNDSGQVVGSSYTTYTTGNAAQHAFISAANGGSLTDLGTLGGIHSGATGINNNGQAVGFANTTGDATSHTFISTANGGSLTDLGTLGGTYSQAFGINNSGRVVGYSGTTSGVQHAFISAVNGGSLTDLGTLGGTFSQAFGINNNGQVVGWANNTINEQHAFISAANGGSLTDLGTLGGSISQALGINNSGQVVGYSYITGNTAYHAFISYGYAGSMTDLGTLGGTYSQALGINNTGQVVGHATATASGPWHAFLYTGSKMVDLTTLTGNSTLDNATGINSYAQIAVNGNSAYLLTLNPTWSASGSGSWESASNWNFGGAGALNGLTPGNPHDVVINPTTAAVISGPYSNTRVNSLTLGGLGGAGAELDLGNGTLVASNGITINSNGKLGGSGILQGAVSNTGLINVNGGQRLQLTGDSTTNTSVVSVLGTGVNPAELDNNGAFNNNLGGRIVLQNALYRGGGTATTGKAGTPTTITNGLTNAGQILVTGTDNNIFGPVNQVAGGQTILSGNSNTTFYDTFVNNGTLKVSTGSTATFFGLVTGAGLYAGTGTSFYEGIFHVGNSPALITIENISNYDSSSKLTMDLAGLTAGGCTPDDCAHYAQIIFNNDVQFNGGELAVSFYNDFTAQAGDLFDLFQFNGKHSGEFGSLLLPTLANGLSWDTSKLYLDGAISVAAVPLPASIWTMGATLAGLLGLVRRRTVQPTQNLIV